MTATRPNLFTRDDTFLGVCEAIGEDCGFHPNYLRVALGTLVLWNPAIAVGLYLGAGVLVFLSRWWMPSRPAHAAEPVGASAAIEPIADNDRVPLAIAA